MRAIAKPVPEYEPGAKGWLSIEQLCNAIGVKPARLSRIRKEIGSLAEHKVGANDCDPVYFYAPVWLLQWAATATSPQRANGRVSSDHKQRKEKAQADKAELEVLRLRGELIHVDDVLRDYERLAGNIRRALELAYKVSPEAYRIIEDALNENEQEIDAPRGDVCENS